MTASPAATVLMAATSSPGRTSLSRKPLAPARSAPKAYSSRSKVVRTRTLGSGPAAVIRWVASMPSVPGIRTSISTTSGRVPAGEIDGLLAVARLRHHGQVVLGLQDHAEAAAQQRLVVR